MNKIKLFLGVALFGAMSFGAFSAYEYATMSEEERFFIANIEALTTTEPGGGGTERCYYRGQYYSGAHYFYCIEDGYCRRVDDHMSYLNDTGQSCTPVK